MRAGLHSDVPWNEQSHERRCKGIKEHSISKESEFELENSEKRITQLNRHRNEHANDPFRVRHAS